MTITHHPSDETLLQQAAGMLSAGPALVVAVHLEGCESCRRRLLGFEAVGGALLETMPPQPMRHDALARALGRLDQAPSPPRPSARPPTVMRHRRVELDLPASLQHCEIGRWRWGIPGFRWSRVTIPGYADARVVLLKGKAGLRLPLHGHAGTEYLQVLSGALSDARGRYLPGDLDEVGSDVDHRPAVDADSECVCLVALEGDTLLRGPLGRLLWSVIGF
jgi:putative transcriptional regulator